MAFVASPDHERPWGYRWRHLHRDLQAIKRPPETGRDDRTVLPNIECEGKRCFAI